MNKPKNPGVPGCQNCNGKGFVRVTGTCRECDGDGHTDCFNCGHDMVCKKCSGTGAESQDEECYCVPKRKAQGQYLSYLEQTALK